MTGLGVDEILARGDASGVYYYLPDGLGSTVALTDGAGTVQTEYTYAPTLAFVRTAKIERCFRLRPRTPETEPLPPLFPAPYRVPLHSIHSEEGRCPSAGRVSSGPVPL